jgi:putative membrane protein
VSARGLLAATNPDLTPHPWRWVPHPEVWVMVAVLALMYLYATRVVGPKVVPPGEPIITRSQSRWYFTGLVLLWVTVDWPFHDLAEDYLYSIHMVQHLLLTWVIPPMMLMAMPEWLGRLVLGRGRTYRVFRLLTLPLVAGVLYNVVFALGHLPVVVNDSIRWSAVHFTVHLVIIFSAILMWNCVCGPLKELRASLPVQCIYLFLIGVLSIIPGAWLTYSQDVVYTAYIHPWHSFWGLTTLGDQQLAGFIMRAIGGMYSGIIIIVLFFRWARELTANDDDDRRARDRERIARFRAEHPESATPSGRTGQPTPG